jgi:ribonuclease D
MQRAAAKALARWRESFAMKSDKPRGWILADEALREIAERRPVSTSDLEQIRGLPAAVIRKRGAEILKLIEQSAALASEETAAYAPARPDPQQVAKVARLMAYVRAEGERQKISPELLATRRDIENYVFSRQAPRLFNGWRRAAIGERLAEI